ncbi:ParB N-terminal domain-containing protein [Paracoccus sp. 11-3]|uniref:ParB N-terminal domain-containing protein n=1 Tax=Paracoccus amoyensis TaxID=2760093 RepID=A0A926GG36_9RHOB|nr:ParB N-terminal domain-containing protein [Paracoccus amoyensis]MBC9246709.1 ParB N-terminal domain-containing protein [Paracoccus amoyensis]
MSETIELPLTLIQVGADRARDLDPAWAEGLAAIIETQGLFHPISVRKIGADFHLVSGMHRLEAFRLLEREAIPATLSQAESDDAARLEEVMENLGRNELIALDRCHHLSELKQVWERMYPQAGHGGDRKSEAIKWQTLPLDPSAPEIFGFSEAVADKIGLSARSIRLAVKIWSGLVPTVRRRLAGTALAEKQTELKALSELNATKQIKALDAILNRDLPEIGNVAQALAYLDGGTVCDPLEKRFASVSKTIAGLDEDTFDSVIAAHEERVIASLKRRGRL